MTGPETDGAAAQLLERLLTDPAFRARFRRDPATAAREAGLESVAQEMTLGAGKAMDTLDARESRSSLAGVLMAAALEGVSVYDFANDAVPHLAGIPHSVEQVLSRLGPPTASAATGSGGAGADAVAFDQGSAPASSAPRAQDAGEFKAITPEQAAAARAIPDEPVVPEGDAAKASGSLDPAQYGSEGTGGPPSEETLALLRNKNVTFDSDGVGDMKAGKMDPRVVSMLTAIAKEHKITVSATISDHNKLSSGGSVSNHYYGRGVDISIVDGTPVSPGNGAAHQVASSLSSLPADIRPSEVGSPWALPGSADFTDGAHQNHLHIAYDDPIAKGWQVPDDLASDGGGGVAPETAAPGGDGSEDSSDGGDEPGGLEDPGGDTDAEADEESDGDDGDDNDSVSDDPSDEEEDDEDEEEDEDELDDSGDGGDSASNDNDSDSDSSDGGSGNSGASDSGDPGIDLSGAGDYPGDSASRAEMAAWMGSQAQKRGMPPELPVMAALVESGLKNLDGGDADSVGFFQMRVGIWNKGDYAGYPDNPELQLKWFLDQAAAVKQQRLASGKPVDDAGSYGEWIADTERPAEQYRGRYQPRLEEARGLLKEGAGS